MVEIIHKCYDKHLNDRRQLYRASYTKTVTKKDTARKKENITCFNKKFGQSLQSRLPNEENKKNETYTTDESRQSKQQLV